MKRVGLFFLCAGLLLVGCKRPADSVANQKNETGIFGQSTSNIGEFDPNAGGRVSDSQIDENRLATPIVGPLAAYGPIIERLSKMHIEQAVNLFYAEHGRFPKSYEEFMERIVRANHIELPVLPGNLQYQYDVENHRLEVVEIPPAEDDN